MKTMGFMIEETKETSMVIIYFFVFLCVCELKNYTFHSDQSLLKNHGGPLDISKPWAASLLARMIKVKRKGTHATCKILEDFDVKKAFLTRYPESTLAGNIHHFCQQSQEMSSWMNNICP